jgi:hypothetical protein
MPRIARSRVKHLERLANVDGPPIGRLLLLIPDLWPDANRAAFNGLRDLEALGDLVERRTGVRPTFGMDGFRAIAVPATVEMLAMTEEAKAAFLAAHETRPQRPDHWDWRGNEADDAP